MYCELIVAGGNFQAARRGLVRTKADLERLEPYQTSFEWSGAVWIMGPPLRLHRYSIMSTMSIVSYLRLTWEVETRQSLIENKIKATFEKSGYDCNCHRILSKQWHLNLEWIPSWLGRKIFREAINWRQIWVPMWIALFETGIYNLQFKMQCHVCSRELHWRLKHTVTWSRL